MSTKNVTSVKAQNLEVLDSNDALLAQLSPATLWYVFGEICSIPHGSGNEGQLANHIANIMMQSVSKIDSAGNVIISIPATPGFESVPSICLQGHIDMVCEKINGSDHDFKNDPIKLIQSGNILKADGTTLGADNGIGAAAAIAIALEEKQFNHGPLEILLTVQEEIGFYGVKALDPTSINSRIILNLDSEEFGEFFIGCAGGGTLKCVYQPVYEEPAEDLLKYRFNISGLKGGHSGLKIHEDRANAIKAILNIIGAFNGFDLRLGGLTGGTKMNVIPSDAQAIVWVPEFQSADFIDEFKLMMGSPLMGKYLEEKNVIFTLTPLPKETDDVVLSFQSQKDLVGLLGQLPHGVQSFEVDGSVQTSNNLALVKEVDGTINIYCMYRSSSEEKIDELEELILNLYTKFGADCTKNSDDRYPAWQPNFQAVIIEKCAQLFYDMYGFKPELKNVHAGLECGEMYKKISDAEYISFGPNMNCVHSPDEELDIESVGKFYNFLLALITSYTVN